MLELVNISKSYEKNHVLKNISLTVNTGEVVTIIGKSGTGKSTLLRCINMLEKTDAGSIFLDGVDISTCNVCQIRQKIGMVFQEYYLFNNLSVLENITVAPIKLLKQKPEEANEWAIDLLKKFDLEDKKDAYPSELSGGQKQRIAIIRTLSVKPEVILFDEPTSALDMVLTQEVVKQVKALSKAGMTILIVTHDLGFAKQVSDRVVYMEEGEIIEEGSVEQIFNLQKDERTKRFVTGDVTGLNNK